MLNIKQEGGGVALKRLWFRFFRINTFYIFSLNLSKFNLSASDLSWSKVEELNQGKLCDLRLQYDHLPSEFYIDQLDPGKRQRCFVCFVNDIPALILWLCPNQSSGFVRVGAKEIEMNHIYCRLQFRGRKILQNTIRTIASQMQEEGFYKIFTVVHSDNIACIKSIKRCGFKRIGELKRLGFFVWKT